MSNLLSITLFQTNIIWENAAENKIIYENILKQQLNYETDILVFPEMFSTGFTMNPKAIAEPMNGSTVNWMHKIANTYNCAVCGSLVITENNKFYNRFVFIAPNTSNVLGVYDKKHLFSMSEEALHYEAGTQQAIIAYKGWNICPLICYDIRFPVFSRNCNNKYDVLLYVANFPQVRVYAWQQLLVARAIENLAYTIGVNRVGTDKYGFEHNGCSAAVDFKGKLLAQYINTSGIYTHTLNYDELNLFRQQFPAHLDAEKFVINE